MTVPNRPLGYERRTQRVDSGHGVETVAVFTCRRCPATLTLHMRKDPTANNPEFMARKARDHGWQSHKNKANRTLCPECSKTEKVRVIDVTPEPAEEPAAMASNPPTAKITPFAAAIASSSSLTPMAKAVAPDSKTRIRALLDKHFDDSRGVYLDGYSDQRIGLELDLPWKAVADLREVAYGPLREDPEMVEMKAAIETMSVKLGDRITDFHKWTEEQRKLIDDLRRRMLALEQRKAAP